MTINTLYLRLLRVMVFGALIISPFSLYAGSVTGIVLDDKGSPVKDAVLTLIPVDPSQAPEPAITPGAIMTQKDRTFIPYVLPVRTGTPVSFPNEDDLLHHVYSFSETKRFEISLYAGTPVNPIVFETAGVVPLGCNIHDWMLSYIYVTDAPYFAKSNEAGKVEIRSIPDGKYRAQIWHPRLKGKIGMHEQEIIATGGGSLQIEFDVSLKRERRRNPPDYFYDRDY